MPVKRVRMNLQQTCFKYTSCKLGERLGEIMGLGESLLKVLRDKLLKEAF